MIDVVECMMMAALIRRSTLLLPVLSANAFVGPDAKLAAVGCCYLAVVWACGCI